MANSVSILSLVGNFYKGSLGPGHSAIAVDQTVYSFQVAIGGGWMNKKGSGWLIIARAQYLAQNRHRPVVVQDLKSGRVNADQVLDYLKASDSDDDDYIGSGVCSTQVSYAIDAGTTMKFNPPLFDHPATVYHWARFKGLVDSTSVLPPVSWTLRSKLLLNDLYFLNPDGSASRGPFRVGIPMPPW